MKLLPRFLLLSFLLSFKIAMITAYFDEAFKAAIYTHQSEGVTEEEIRKWWYRTQAKRRGFPRAFPFCFDTYLPLPQQVIGFENIMQKLRDVTEYDPDVFGWPNRKINPKNLFDTMKHNRISIKPANPDPNIFGPGRVEGEHALILTQWVDFVVTLKEPIRGMYVQAYGGPFGVPIGEFTTEFRCTAGEIDDQDYSVNTNVVPCHFAPRTAYVHPNVLIFNTEDRAPKKKVQFRFRWTETHCHETGFFQFIMMATKNWTDTSLILSPIYRYNLDFPTAVPFPYHPYYDEVTCGLPTNPSTNKIVPTGNGTRIMPNKEYDLCILSGIGRGYTDLDRHTCPPGYFICEQHWNNIHDWNAKVQMWWDAMVIGWSTTCCELKFPLQQGLVTTTEDIDLDDKTEPPPPPPSLQEQQEKFLKDVTTKSQKKQQSAHGDFCILVWMVFIPVANLISRFFKDFSEFRGVGLGFWIIGHGVLHTIGLMLVWWSFGLVVGGGEDRLGNISGRHFLLGTVATVIQHAECITGLKRSDNERRIFGFVLIHSVGGYLAHFIAYITILLSNADAMRKWISLGLFMIWMIAAIAFHFVEVRQDRVLGVVFHRAQCPILQRIVMDGGARPPMWRFKIVILAILFVSCCIIYIFMKVYFPVELGALKHQETFVSKEESGILVEGNATEESNSSVVDI